MKYLIIIISILIFSFLLLTSGSVEISLVDTLKTILSQVFQYNNQTAESLNLFHDVIFDIRLPRLVAALSAGAALALCGLLMQTYFSNPLADPYILGVHGGSSLGVAFWILGSSVLPTTCLLFINGEFLNISGMVLSSILGACFVFLLLLFLSWHFANKLAVLFMGVLIGHMFSGIVSLLVAYSDNYKIKAFLLWSLGSFSRVTLESSFVIAATFACTLLWSIFLINKLNLLLLGDNYATINGVNVKRLRIEMLAIASIISGVVISFCGPIIFIGALVPHLARFIFKTNNHKTLIISSAMIGGMVTLIIEYFVGTLLSTPVPINSVLGILGAPLLFIFVFLPLISKYKPSGRLKQ